MSHFIPLRAAPPRHRHPTREHWRETLRRDRRVTARILHWVRTFHVEQALFVAVASIAVTIFAQVAWAIVTRGWPW